MAYDDRYLDGGRDYTLTISTPVPAVQSWSVAVYGATTRSGIDTEQGNADLRSIFELADSIGGDRIEPRFGPEPSPDGEDRWVKTTPGRGCFVYLRLYEPTEGALYETWKLGDFIAGWNTR